MLTQPAFGPRVALASVTFGSLLDVWTLVWYHTRESALTTNQQFWVVGLALTGLTFLVLGLLLGRLGRSAREAELPPPEAIQAEAAIEHTAAANPPAVAVMGTPPAPAAPLAANAAAALFVPSSPPQPAVPTRAL
ncbi:MAG: hypothetical protein U0792_02815 [Gemmataceae bacterium]